MTDLQHQFLWLDVETTTLDPQKGTILEVACALADDAPGGDFEIVDAFEHVAAGRIDGGNRRFLPAGTKAWIDVPSGVWQMHSVNGLWEDCQSDAAVPLPELDRQLAEWLAGHGATKNVTLAGFSVHFDLGWARVHLPRVAKLLHYRVFDVSTLIRACELWAEPAERPDVIEHRALADVVASIEIAKRCRDAFARKKGGR